MSEMCAFHPEQRAAWLCPACNENYCEQCIVQKGAGPRSVDRCFCPKCQGRAEWIGAANLLPPFWERLHRFFIYPFTPRTVILMAVMAGINLFLGGIPLLGLLIRLAVGFLMLRYAYEILKATAKGKLVPPRIDLQALSRDMGPVLKQYLMFLFLAVVGVFVATAAGPLVLVYGVFVLLFAPAMLIVLVATSSLRKALNPTAFIGLAWRIGPAYLLMYLFLVLLAAAPGILARFASQALSPPLTAYLLFLAELYYMFVSFHLIGYVLLQYHTEIGYQVRYEDFQEERGQAAQTLGGSGAWNERGHVENLLQQGRVDEALAFLDRRFQAGSIREADLARAYYDLLGMKGEGQPRSGAARLLLARLLEENRRQEAAGVFEESLRADPGFLPEAENLFELGEIFENTGRPKAAIKIFQAFCRSYARHAKAPEAHFRIAMILNDRLLMPEKAKGILERLKSKYPDHPILPKVENYLHYSLPS